MNQKNNADKLKQWPVNKTTKDKPIRAAFPKK